MPVRHTHGALLMQVQQMRQNIESVHDGVHGTRKPGKVILELCWT